LQNYYQILGLSNFASQGEVKNAFRRLAKLYHPDVNPNGQEHFKNVVKAYEILSDTYKKSQYDYKLKFHLNQAARKTEAHHQKFANRSNEPTDQELRRRQYFHEHYKKENQYGYVDEPDVPKTHNEFKNILIATPLTVLLIMLVLNVWNDKPQIKVVSYKEEIKKKEVEDIVKRKRIVTGDEPYAEYFGGSKQDTIAKRKMKFKNMTGSDLILFLFDKKEFIRSCYIEHGYEVDFDMLPKELSSIRIMKGKNFEYIKEVPKAGVYGAFEENCKFYLYKKKLKLNGNNQIVLTNILDEGFEEVKGDNFFKKES